MRFTDVERELTRQSCDCSDAFATVEHCVGDGRFSIIES